MIYSVCTLTKDKEQLPPDISTSDSSQYKHKIY